MVTEFVTLVRPWTPLVLKWSICLLEVGDHIAGKEPCDILKKEELWYLVAFVLALEIHSLPLMPLLLLELLNISFVLLNILISFSCFNVQYITLKPWCIGVLFALVYPSAVCTCGALLREWIMTMLCQYFHIS